MQRILLHTLLLARRVAIVSSTLVVTVVNGVRELARVWVGECRENGTRGSGLLQEVDGCEEVWF